MGCHVNTAQGVCTAGWGHKMDPLPLSVEPLKFHCFLSAALFILGNFKLFLSLSFFKLSSVIQIWTKMKRWTFPPPSSATDKQKWKPSSYMLFVCLFVCFCFRHRFLLYDSSAGKERNWCKEFSNVFLKSCRGYAYQHTDSLMSDSGGAISCS